MSGQETVIVYAGRTAIGKLSGAFANTPAPLLASALIKDAIAKLELKGEEVDEVVLGNVLSAGIGQAPARQAAIYGGLPKSVCATTINRVCGSGLKAVMLADQAIKLGDANVVLAGGMENMSLAPHILPKSRQGFRFGSVELKDHMQFDGLWDPYGQVAMGNCGDICAKEYGFSRPAQDEFARASYERARAATERGYFAKEIVPYTIADKKKSVVIDRDEEPFASDLDRLADLRPAFGQDGSITAGNASSINDGAALVLVTSLQHAKARGWKPLAKIVAHASHAQDPTWFTTAPVKAIEKVVAKAALKLSDIDLFEINEAFAVVPMAAMKDLGLEHSKVNIYGGAVAIGHPLGASGARVLVTLLNAMQNSGKRRGLATLCIGGGEASAMIVEAT
jgi:acetyl-CoA C-acetyltransferase